MAKYNSGTEALEEALAKGESSISGERGVGLRGKVAEELKKKKNGNNWLAKAIARNWLLKKGRELYGGEKTYLGESPTERRTRVRLESE